MGETFFTKSEEIEKSALDERKFLGQIFKKISGVEFWTEKSEKSCHCKAMSSEIVIMSTVTPSSTIITRFI